MAPMTCPLCCSLEFTSKSELLNHLKSVNSNLKCPFCNQHSLNLSTLVLHLQNQCSTDSQISSRPSLPCEETPVQCDEQSLSTKQINLTPDVFVNSNNTACSSREKSILLRKRKKLIPVSRKAASKNNSTGKTTELSNKYGETSTKITEVESSDLHDTNQRPILQFNNGNDWTISKSSTVDYDDLNAVTDLPGFGDQPAPSSTGEQTAESEVDLDNVSMISDESSFTTNDYSSSQNEILSDDDCSEIPVGYTRLPIHAGNASRQAGMYRNNAQSMGNNGFINNLQVINNNFYTILLNNGSYEGTSGTIPNDRNGNYQRRNTKNNNSQMNNNCISAPTLSAAEHSNVPSSVSMHNNLHGNRAAKNFNLRPINAGNNAVSLPGPSHFTVSNDSPNKYAVKNTNITKNIPVTCKEISTTNLETRHCLRPSVPADNTNTNEEIAHEGARVNDESGMVNHSITRLEESTSPISDNSSSAVLQNTMENLANSELNHHQLISRSISSRMQKIQNVDCIQNSTTSLTLNPPTSALCKTNSFPLCNYIRSQQGANKCKLIKYNANGKLNNTNETETLLNNTLPNQEQIMVPGNTMNVVMVMNDIAEANMNNLTNTNEGDGNTTNISSESTMSCGTENATSQTIPPIQINRNQNTIDSSDPTEPVENSFQSELSASDSHSELANVYAPSSSDVNNKNVCNGTDVKQIDSKISTNLGLGLIKNQSLESNFSNEINSDQSNRRASPNTSFDYNAPSINSGETVNEATPTALQSTSNMSYTLNNSNSLNNISNGIPTTTANIVNFNNNLHKNKKSNLNQLGRRNNKEEKLFTMEKEPNGQQNVTVASDSSSSSSYQVINNSIERNFNKLNTCSQEINAHKHVKSTQSNRKSKKSKRPILEEHAGRINNTGAELSVNIPMSGSFSQSVASNCNTVEINTNTETSPSTSANLFQDMNNSTQTNHNRSQFNNNHSKLDATDKTTSKTFTKKDLLNIKRNNFDFGTQEHSNVRRSNSLHIRINDLATSGTNSATQPDDTQRKSITKSNSFTIRNNISEPGPSQERSFNEKKQNSNSTLGMKSQAKLIDLKNNISKRLENVDLNFDADGSSTNESERRSTLSESYSRDAFEQYRLEEASNDGAIVLNGNEENDPFLNEKIEDIQADQPVFGSFVLNNCVDNPENTLNSAKGKPNSSFPGSSSSSVNAIVNPRMIHNNIEPRCKKNKKCNEEREPLKPINSETKNKPSE